MSEFYKIKVFQSSRDGVCLSSFYQINAPEYVEILPSDGIYIIDHALLNDTYKPHFEKFIGSKYGTH